jgi:uncharacterized protein (TIGR03083 family)
MTASNDEPGIDLLELVWVSIVELGDGLDEDDWKSTTELPGWTVQDNLSHVIGTERMMRGDPTPENDPAPAEHVHNPIGELNEHWVEHYRDRSGAEVLDEFRQLSGERLAELRAMPPERFDEIGPTPVGEAPFREFVNVRIFDSWIHEQDMRRALDRPGHQHGPAVDHSMGRMAKAMPFVVAKQAAAPDGTSVVFVVRHDDPGAPPFLVPVVVDGRASVVEREPAEPTVRLELDLSDYIALGTGRGDPESVLGEGRVTIIGDDELGRTVIRQLSFMI